MNKNKELFKNILIFGVGTFGSKLIQFLLVPLYTIYLSTTEYSVSDLITSTIHLITPLLTIGISNGILRFVLGQSQNRKSILKFAVVICFSGTAVLTVLTPFINRIEMFSGYGYMIPLLYISSSLHTLLAQYCKAIEKNVAYAVDGILASLTLTVGSIILISVFKLGVMGYLLAYLISKSLSVIYFTIICSIPKTLRKAAINKELTKELVGYSLPLMPNELSWWIIQMSDRYMLTYFAGAALNGLYSMAYKIPSIFNLIVSIFIQAFGITAIKECDEKNNDGKYDGSYFQAVYSKYISLTFVAVVFIILASRPIAYIILKKSFFDSWVYIPFLLCAYAIGNLQSFYGSIYGGIKKSKLVFYSTFSGALVNIVLNLLLIPYLKAYGAAIATIISYIVVYLVRLHNIKKYVSMNHYEMKIIVSIALMLGISILYSIGNIVTILISVVLSIVMIVIYINDIKEGFELSKKIIFKIFGKLRR